MSQTEIQQLLSGVNIVPVMVINEIEQAVPMARALFEGGLKALEITLRTEHGLQAIRDIKAAIPDAMVGAGTVISPQLAKASVEAGVDFMVTPGTSAALLHELIQLGVPTLPGANTISEMMTLAEHGFDTQKFFPAEAAGGTAMLKSVAGPLPQLSFCPTGGIKPETAPDYLALANVVCVGGSWMLPADKIKAGDWDSIHQLAAQSAAITA